MKIVINQESLCFPSQLSIKSLYTMIDEDLLMFRGNYPLFDKWFQHVVIPGLLKSERTIVIEKRQDVVAGILILKHTSSESKICSLRVRPQFENSGLGVRLFQQAFDILETESPLLSISEHNYSRFERIFKYFGFSHEKTYMGIYRPNIQELSYNGILDERHVLKKL